MKRFVLPPSMVNSPVDIVLAGAGGTGSQMADQLASLEATLRRLGHPGFRVAVYDPDTVSASNIGRQRFTASDVGASKSMLLVHRINAFYGLNWRAYVEPLSFEGENQYFHADMLITAVDKALFRAEVGQTFRRKTTGALWLDMGNDMNSGNVVLGHLAARCGQDTSIRLPNIFDLYPELARMEAADREEPSCSTEEAIARQEWPVNRVAAMIGSELLWSLFRHGSITTHGAFFKLNPMTVTPLAIDPAAWAFMGYSEGQE